MDHNIILINLDGFRKDKIDLCPNLNFFKESSYYFSEMNTVAPYTFASLHSLFSGTYPSKNGVNGYYNIFRFKKDELYSFTQLLEKAGYHTCCDIIDESVIPSQGFIEKNVFDEKTVNFKERHKGIIQQLASKKKFFLFLHFTETHKNLVEAVIQKYKQESIDDDYFKNIEENNERFNSYLPSCDDYVQTIIKTLEDEKIDDKTILIFFSDHGTSLGEKKGEKFYGVYVYDYTINVFCMMKIPNKPAKFLSNQCSTIDLFPTILDLANIPTDSINQLQGKSLLEFLTNPNALDREVFVETGGLYGPWPSPEKSNVFCIKFDSKKLIYNESPNTWEFYDLKNDPKELNNIYDEHSKLVKIYKKKLIDHFLKNGIDFNFNTD